MFPFLSLSSLFLTVKINTSRVIRGALPNPFHCPLRQVPVKMPGNRRVYTFPLLRGVPWYLGATGQRAKVCDLERELVFQSRCRRRRPVARFGLNSPGCLARLWKHTGPSGVWELTQTTCLGTEDSETCGSYCGPVQVLQGLARF